MLGTRPSHSSRSRSFFILGTGLSNDSIVQLFHAPTDLVHRFVGVRIFHCKDEFTIEDRYRHVLSEYFRIEDVPDDLRILFDPSSRAWSQVFAAGPEIDDISLKVYEDDLKTVPES